MHFLRSFAHARKPWLLTLTNLTLEKLSVKKRGLRVFLAVSICLSTSCDFALDVVTKTIGIVLYDGFSMLDVVGAYQTFAVLGQKGYRMKFIASESGAVRDDFVQSLDADFSFSEVSAVDILYIPGGKNADVFMKNTEAMEWLRQMDKTAEYTMGIGSGAVVLASLGLLDDKAAATHFYLKDEIEALGATYQNEDYVVDGKYITGAGASASIDAVLDVISRVVDDEYAKAAQLFIEYNPRPTFSGNPQKASEDVLRIVDEMVNGTLPEIEKTKTIAILLYDGMTLLDSIGPYGVYKELAAYGYSIRFVAKEKGAIASDFKLTLQADADFSDVTEADLLLLPGGVAAFAIIDEGQPDIIDWIRLVDESTKFTTSVCTGALLMAEAGFLDGEPASTHWYAGRYLKEYGAYFSQKRVTRSRKYISGAGVSAGIDQALFVASLLEGDDVAQAIQLKIGYRPQPPFDAGTPEKSSPETVEMLSNLYGGAVDRARQR